MNWLSSLLGNLNYGTIFFLMLLESTVIPVPSELVVSPAAYHAAGGNLNVFLVILFATIGADCGATINYFAGYYLGRPIIYRFANSKWGRMCLLNQQKVEKSEKFFYDHGVIATLTGRLLPGIRHLISIPAGLSKMKFWKFILYTTIGASVELHPGTAGMVSALCGSRAGTQRQDYGIWRVYQVGHHRPCGHCHRILRRQMAS